MDKQLCKLYFDLFDTDDNIFNLDTECDKEPEFSKVGRRYNYGCFCRSCNEYNCYAEIDNIIDDSKYTCWRCAKHPERKLKGLPYNKVKNLDELYKGK